MQSRAILNSSEAKFEKITPIVLKKKEETINDRIPEKILVCAPSNESLDNLIRMFMQNSGLYGIGENFKPKIVRVGPYPAEDVKKYSIEEMAFKKMKGV